MHALEVARAGGGGGLDGAWCATVGLGAGAGQGFVEGGDFGGRAAEECDFASGKGGEREGGMIIFVEWRLDEPGLGGDEEFLVRRGDAHQLRDFVGEVDQCCFRREGILYCTALVMDRDCD